MKKNLSRPKQSLTLFLLMFLLMAGSFTACKRNPPIEKKEISRLYVSYANTETGIANLEVFEETDKNPTLVLQANTEAKDGNGVFVDQATDILFQASRQNKSVSVFANASMLSSNPPPMTIFTDNSLNSAREIAYDNGSKTLFVANNADSSIRVYMSPASLSGNVTGKKLKLSAEPWGIHYDASSNRLLVLIDKNGRRIEVYKNPSSLAEGMISPNSVFNVADRPNGELTRLHGLTYSSKLDVLLITEIGEAAAPSTPVSGKPAFNADGGIYIFANAGSKLASGGTFNADRIIYGSNTGLGNPVDIAIDDVNEKLIYAAEKANKKILIFKLSDKGNQSPAMIIPTEKLPEDIFLDIRKYSGNSNK